MKSTVECLRLMYNLLVLRGYEYDANGFSDLYWSLTDEYERAKAAWRLAKANATD